MRVRVIITGRHYDAAVAMPEVLELDDGCGVDDALRQLAALQPAQAFPSSCLLVVSGQHLGTLARHADRRLSDGDELALIAPVAGG